MRQLQKEEIDSIIENYVEKKKSINVLRKQFKLQFKDIKNILIEHNVMPRTHRDSRKKYEYNEDYFSTINTPEKAYWLGFIYADGFITKKTNGNPVFGLTLAEKEPLIKLNRCLNSNKPIGEYKKRGYKKDGYEYKLAFCSEKLVSDLEKWGCVENKTFKLKFPSFLDENLRSHFIRGFFDGDGSVFLHIIKHNNNEYIALGVTICGIKNFLYDLSKHINTETCIYKDKRKITDCYSIKLLSNIRCLHFYHYIYKNAGDMCLTRKRDKFENFIKDRGSTTIISNPTYKKLYYIED